MPTIRRRGRRRQGRPAGRIVEFLGQPFPASDLVLLCTFGPDLSGPRTRQELRDALSRAGYDGALGRHLLQTSALLQRRPGKEYALRQAAAVQPNGSVSTT